MISRIAFMIKKLLGLIIEDIRVQCNKYMDIDIDMDIDRCRCNYSCEDVDVDTHVLIHT